MKWVHLIASVAVCWSLISCTAKKADLGSSENPLKIFFVFTGVNPGGVMPAPEVTIRENKAKILQAYLEKTTPYKFAISNPHSVVAVIESFGPKQADVAMIDTFAYLVIRDKYDAEARATVLRHGSATYISPRLAAIGGPDSSGLKTNEITNDPIIFRKDIPEEMKSAIVSSLLSFASSGEGPDVLEKLGGFDGLRKATDSDYDRVRKILNDSGKKAADLMQK